MRYPLIATKDIDWILQIRIRYDVIKDILKNNRYGKLESIAYRMLLIQCI